MYGFFCFCVLILAPYTLIQTVLSAPHVTSRNVSSSPLDLVPQSSSSLVLHPLNSSHPFGERGIEYHVPDSMTTLFFSLGFPCKDEGMIKTIIGARDYCEQQLEEKGDCPLFPYWNPFKEDLGYGTAITVFSSRPDRRLTWSIVKDAMEGLWTFLVIDGRFVESEFDIHHEPLGLVGRGTVEDVSETGLARQRRKRGASDSLGL